MTPTQARQRSAERNRTLGAKKAREESTWAPDFTGSLCAGKPAMFETSTASESELLQARGTCWACPLLATCIATPKEFRPIGMVLAGQVVNDRGNFTDLDRWMRRDRRISAERAAAHPEWLGSDAAIRAGHAEYRRCRDSGTTPPPGVIAAEAAYQRRRPSKAAA